MNTHKSHLCVKNVARADFCEAAPKVWLVGAPCYISKISLEMPVNVSFYHTSYNCTEGLTAKRANERYFYSINQMCFGMNTNVCLLLWGFSLTGFSHLSFGLPGSPILGHMITKELKQRDLGLFLVWTLQNGIRCKTTSLIFSDVLHLR